MLVASAPHQWIALHGDLEFSRQIYRSVYLQYLYVKVGSDRQQVDLLVLFIGGRRWFTKCLYDLPRLPFRINPATACLLDDLIPLSSNLVELSRLQFDFRWNREKSGMAGIECGRPCETPDELERDIQRLVRAMQNGDLHIWQVEALS